MSAEIIAEIGVNHLNDLGRARRMIDEASIAGADAVKFQASNVREEISHREASDHFREIAKLVPSHLFLRMCKDRCDELGIEFLCTPAGPWSLEFLMGLGVKRIKVASDNLTNVPFLRAVAQTNLPVILSTGMATMKEIQRALVEFRFDHEVTVLHCGSAYPLPNKEANLRALPEMIRVLGPSVQVGWSDHTTDLCLAGFAVAMGAVMIEKHFTLSNDDPGPDHKASLEPFAFKTMVGWIRAAEACLGDGEKRLMPSEAQNVSLYRKSLVASGAVKKGETFTPANMAVKRPGTGRSPLDWDSMIGKQATRDYAEDELIE